METNKRFKSIKEFRVYRRNLPHYELPGSVYFITFRTTSGLNLSDSTKDIILSSFKFHADKKYTLHACVVMNDHVHCILQPLEKSDQGLIGKMPVSSATPSVADKMPVTPGTYYSLAHIMHSIMSYSSTQINKIGKTNGSIWLDESYDRIIRDEAEYQEKRITLLIILWNQNLLRSLKITDGFM
jgi:putative transposase